MEGVDTQKNTQLELLKTRVKYDAKKFGDNTVYESVLTRLLEDSKYIALSLRYPYQDYSNMELPKKYNNWQLRCCEELLGLMGTNGIKSYAENGLSWTRDSASISHNLMSEIEPMVGYIIVEETEVSENV
jgi:hypothetical protein